MNTLLLNKLVLENFKGITALTVEPNGKDIAICGANKLGKTTTGDAVTWLLFGKDMQGRGDKKSNIKTLDSTGAEISHIDHSVEGSFLFNGDEIVLKKILKEKHTKKRGEAKKSFTGNVTEYHIDGLKTSAGKYAAAVSDITDEQTFRLLTVPFFFAEGLKWEERRKILLGICGDVSDADIIAGSKKLVDLPGILNGKNAEEEYLPHLKDQRKNVNDQLDNIPTRIDENSRSLPDISGIDARQDSITLISLSKEIDNKNITLAGIGVGGASIELKQSMIEIDGKIAKHVTDANDLQAEYVRAKKGELSELQQKEKTADLDIDVNKTTLARLKKELDQTKADLASISKEYDELAMEKFTPTPGIVCDKCDVVTPDDKQLAAFRVGQSFFLEALNERGVKLTEDMKATKGQIEEVTAKIDAGEKNNNAGDVATCQSELNELENPSEQKALTEEHAADLKEKVKIQADIDKAGSGDVDDLKEKIEKEIASLMGKRADVVERIDKVTKYGEVEKRNEELQEEEKKLSIEFDRIESELFLIEEFIKAKVYSLGVKVAEQFGDVQFKLFDQAINGGVQPCCEVLVNGVPFGTVNNADRINTGLEIINVLSKHYDIQVPIVVDNAESINQLGSAGSQMISLVVTEDPKLVFKQ